MWFGEPRKEPRSPASLLSTKLHTNRQSPTSGLDFVPWTPWMRSSAGLEYAYISTGEALIFLHVERDDPTAVYYHLITPNDDVEKSTEWDADSEGLDRLHLTTIGQILLYTLQNLSSRYCWLYRINPFFCIMLDVGLSSRSKKRVIRIPCYQPTRWWNAGKNDKCIEGKGKGIHECVCALDRLRRTLVSR